MQSTLTSREADPHDVFLIETVLAAAKQAASEPTHAAAAPAEAATGAAAISPPLAPQINVAPDISRGATAPSVDAPFRAGATDEFEIPRDIQISGEQPPTSRFARRMVMSLFAVVTAIGAAAWQHYGDDAKAMVARWTPPFALASSAAADKPALAAQPDASAIPASTADQAAAQPAPAEAAAPVATASSADQSQLQSMARDVAAMGQQIEQLKASIEQIKASQSQASRDTSRTEARLSEPAPRPRLSTPSARTAAAPAPVRKPKPATPPVQAAAAPAYQVAPAYPAAPAYPPVAAAPPQQQFEPSGRTLAEDGEPVVRPPMPLR